MRDEDGTKHAKVKGICGHINPEGRQCLQPEGHRDYHRNSEHAWPKQSTEAAPWVTVGFVAEPGDPEDTYRLSVTREGVTHYIGALIEGWENAQREARALSDVLGSGATIGPAWSDTQAKLEAQRDDLGSVPWREKFFWADCTLDGLYGVVEECCRAIQETPEGAGNRGLVDLILLKLHNGLAEVDREYTNAETSPHQSHDREALAEALYESWCEGVQVGKGCFGPYGWEDLKLLSEPDHTPNAEQFYEKADAILAQEESHHGDRS